MFTPNLPDAEYRHMERQLAALIAQVKAEAASHASIEEFTAEYAPTPEERVADKARHSLTEYDIDEAA
jgi:hypothetical protein